MSLMSEEKVLLMALGEQDVRWLSDVLHHDRVINQFGATEEIRRVRGSVLASLGNGSRDADRVARATLEDALATLDEKLTLFDGMSS